MNHFRCWGPAENQDYSKKMHSSAAGWFACIIFTRQNLYRRRIYQSVNVNKAAKLGANQIIEFQDDLPSAFREPLTNKVVLMTSAKDIQAKRKANKYEYNTDLLFACALLFLASNQLELDQVFSHELAPAPTSLFRELGDERYPKNKSVLMNKLKAEVSSRSVIWWWRNVA